LQRFSPRRRWNHLLPSDAVGRIWQALATPAGEVVRGAFVGLVGDADVGDDPPAVGAGAVCEWAEAAIGAALSLCVGEADHRPAHDIAADQLDAVLWAQQQVIECLELDRFHRRHTRSARRRVSKISLRSVAGQYALPPMAAGRGRATALTQPA
jgi:hypothetical protein